MDSDNGRKTGGEASIHLTPTEPLREGEMRVRTREVIGFRVLELAVAEIPSL